MLKYVKERIRKDGIDFTISLLISVVLYMVYVPQYHIDRDNFYAQYMESNIVQKTTFRNPYNCSTVRNCNKCASNPDLMNCTYMSQMMLAGKCNGGYACCQSRYIVYSKTNNPCCVCYEDNYGIPDCLYKLACISDTQAQVCDSVVGSCYKPNITISFPIGNGTLFNVSVNSTCGINDLDCLSKIINYYPRNSVIYYNKDDPNDFVLKGFSMSTPIKCGIIFSSIFGYLCAASLIVGIIKVVR